MEYFALAIAVLFIGAIFSLFASENHKFKICSIFSFLSTVVLSYPLWFVLSTGNPIVASFAISPLFGEIKVVIDVLSAFFIAVISIVSFAGTVYANGYMKQYLNKGMNISSHCFFMMMLIASMLGVVVVQNALFFLVVWELMSLSSFFLVLFEGEKSEVISAGIKYLVYMHLSVIFIIAMFVMLANASNSLDFSVFAETLRKNPQLVNIVFILGFIGFGVKCGLVPFHNWLPDAHPAAPSHVSAMMSGVMLKTGIYGILRTLLLVGTPTKTISYLVLIIAVISVLYGVLYALTQHDIKRLLAYSSIENLGIIMLGIAIGMLGLSYGNVLMATFGFAGGILHVLNHAIFKELMFFGAGSVYSKTHTKNIELLGGLMKKMPYTGFLFVLGSIAICGLPPFNGFISEILVYAGMLVGIPASEINLFIVLVISIAALALVGTLAILCFTKASGIMFLGEARSDIVDKVKSDVSLSMLLPMSVLAVAAFFIGVFPHKIISPILTTISVFVNTESVAQNLNYVIVLTRSISWLISVFLFFILVVLTVRIIIDKKNTTHTTWGCGYDKPEAKMQYTGSSYSNLLVSTLKPLFKRVSHIKKPKELFPKEAYYELEIEDIEEAYIVKPLVKWDEKILAKFERIQNGNIQQYILFGLIFLVIAIVGVIYLG